MKNVTTHKLCKEKLRDLEKKKYFCYDIELTQNFRKTAWMAFRVENMCGTWWWMFTCWLVNLFIWWWGKFADNNFVYMAVNHYLLDHGVVWIKSCMWWFLRLFPWLKLSKSWIIWYGTVFSTNFVNTDEITVELWFYCHCSIQVHKYRQIN